jgi:hypothetical protein
VVRNSAELLERVCFKNYHIVVVLTICQEASSATVMMTTIKNYHSAEKLKTMKRVTNGKSETSLFCEYGIPERTVPSWMKEKNKFHIQL